MRRRTRRGGLAAFVFTATLSVVAVDGGTASAAAFCDGPGERVAVADYPRAMKVDRNANGYVCRYEASVVTPKGLTKPQVRFYDDTDI
ncbi:MAG TPA: hypothetical protein VFU14_16925 [Acidimicrobiales bacterium]|nr:hypothetical protein [Acidimicrobiales bacterium]